MPSTTREPRFQLDYWPIPFRGCFISYLFAYRDVPLLEAAGSEEIGNSMEQPPSEQAVPFMGPPVLRDLATDRALSQMPAIVLYVSRELDLLPADPFKLAMAMKVLMDCNDVLMEICRYNGSMMWERSEWQHFRAQRLPRWMRIFEASRKRGFLGEDPIGFADIAVFALFGNMTRCLPELEEDLLRHAPEIHALCRDMGSRPSLARYVLEEEERFGKLYCGGQIEASIRRMLELDANE